MSKYAGLRTYLEKVERKRQEIRLSFSDIEQAICDKLPASAHKHRPWWANDITHVQAQAWMFAGWLVEDVDASERQVVFRRFRARAEP